jgi:hypothetical protein
VLVFVVLTTWGAYAQPTSRPSAADNTLGFFYKDPRPERLDEIFAALRAQPRKWDAYPPLAGLLAGVFKLHPEQIERFAPNAADPKIASTLLAAMQLSGQRTKAELLRAKSGRGLDERLEVEFAGLPARLEDLRIRTPTHLDILWGASFANGDSRYVQPIIDFFAETANVSELVALDVAKIVIAMAGGPKDVLTELKTKYGEARGRQMVYAASALWATQSNARQHAFVKQTTTKYIQDHPGTPATKALSALTSMK